jgi:hypothetical protein
LLPPPDGYQPDVPLGTAEGLPEPQALKYLKAHGRWVTVRLDEICNEMTDLAHELDSLEAAAVIDEFRAQLANLGERASVRDVALELDGVLTKHGDPAARDTVESVATRLLKYVQR